MADSKLADLTAATSWTTDDYLYKLDSPGGTPVDNYITIEDLFTEIVSGVNVKTTNGIDLGDGAATDQDLLTVVVDVSTTKLIWDESEDRFSINKGLNITADGLHVKNTSGVDLGDGTAQDQDLITVVVDVSTNKLIWDESENAFSINQSLFITTVHGLDVGNGADQDQDLVSVRITTGTPVLKWDESEDRFSINKGLDVTTGQINVKTTDGIDLGDGSATDQDLLTVVVDVSTTKLIWDESEDAFSINKGLRVTADGLHVNTANGIDYNPGSDADVDIITVGVTGTPKIFWDESDSRFSSNTSIEFTDGFLVFSSASSQIKFSPQSDQDLTMLQLNVTGTPILKWDESEDQFSINKGLIISSGELEVGTVQTYTPSNVVTDRSYDADATSTAELADVLGTLIADLQTIGLIG